MPQPMGFHVRLGWSGWFTLLIALSLILAIAAVVATLVLGAFIILLPVALISALLFYLFPGLRRQRPGQRGQVEIIEGEYRVVDPHQLERDTPPADRS
jgi:hypothetical protein